MMKTYEVFLKKQGKDEFRHVGSMQAPDREMAIPLAREAYVRRAEGDYMWLVDRDHLLVAEPDFLAVNSDKPHRHNDGTAIAARRKEKRGSK